MILNGVRVSAVLLTVLGCIIGMYPPFYMIFLGVIVFKLSHSHFIGPGQQHLLVTLPLVIFATAALSYLCFRAASALRRAHRWGAYVAIAFGLFLLWFGGEAMLDLFRPYPPGAVHGEDLFEFLIAVPCIALGMWWCVYLNLPHVRANLNNAFR
jgi:hypothetical protein